MGAFAFSLSFWVGFMRLVTLPYVSGHITLCGWSHYPVWLATLTMRYLGQYSYVHSPNENGTHYFKLYLLKLSLFLKLNV